MSRYYSQQQQYARLDDPEWDPNASTDHLANPADNPSYDQYRSTEHDDEPYNTRTATIPSAYLNSKYPQPGLKGLGQKSKGWFAWSEFSRRKKILVVGSLIALVIIVAVIIAAAATLAGGDDVNFSPSNAKVTNAAAFSSGGATRDMPPKNHDGVGAGEDKYIYYSGDESNFPDSSEWMSYQNMWSLNLPTMQGACTTLGDGDDDTPEDLTYIHSAIRNISQASLVDHRFILAIIMQESQGCVHVGETTSSGGVTNPGLMQSHNGHTFKSDDPWLSILQMVQDGVQGTDAGAGLVYGLNKYGNVYEAARYYNSGKIASNGDLSQTNSGTPCYVSDVANRLTGWTTAKNKCPDNGY